MKEILVETMKGMKDNLVETMKGVKETKGTMILSLKEKKVLINIKDLALEIVSEDYINIY